MHEVVEMLKLQENLKKSCDLCIENVTKWRRDPQECARKLCKNSKSDAEADMNCERPISGSHNSVSIIKNKR